MSNIGNQELGDIILGGEEEALTLGSGQAQAWVEQTYNKHGQSQASIKQTYYQHGQAQGTILDLDQAYGQANADIKQTYPLCIEIAGGGDFILGQDQLGDDGSEECIGAFGQAQASIFNGTVGYGQAQGDIKQTYYVHGQSQGWIESIYFGSGQSQAQIEGLGLPTGQSQADIKQVYVQHGQAQGKIFGDEITAGYGQAAAEITYYYVLDTFTRTTAYGEPPGSPDVGPDLTPVFDGPFDHFDENGRVIEGEFKHRYNLDANDSWFEYLINKADFDYTAEFRIDAATINNSFIELDARTVAGNPNIFATNNGVAFANWRLGTNTGATIVASPIVIQPFVKYALHLQVEGDTARFNVWVAGESEPVGWLIERTGATPGETGSVGFYLGQYSTGSMRLDNISVRPVYTERFQTKIAQAQAFIHRSYGVAQAQALIDKPIRSGQASVFIYPGFELEMGQAQALITPQYLVFLDTFTREIDPTEGGRESLGTPDIGSYEDFFADAPVYSLGTQIESIEIGSNDADFYLEIRTDSPSITASYDFYADEYSIFDDSQFQLGAFNQPNTEGAWVRLETGNGPDDDQFIMEFYDASTLQVPFNLVDGQTYRIRLAVSGTTFQAKIWDLEDPEPGWMLEATQTAFHVSSVWLDLDVGTAPDDTLLTLDNINIYATQVTPEQSYGQAAALIHRYQGYGQARARIPTRTNRHGQARAFIHVGRVHAQARARIKLLRRGHGQAQAFIRNLQGYGQAKSWIEHSYPKSGQANSRIISSVYNVYGQANALIDADSIQKFGQANAFISNASYYLVDTFTRVVSGGMGTPDVGPVWISGSSIPDPSDLTAAEIDGSRLTLTSDGSYQYIYAASPINKKDVIFYGEFEHLSNDAYTGITLLDSITSPFSYISIENNSLGQWQLQAITPSTSIATDLQSLDLIPGVTYSIRFLAQYPWAKVKIWEKNTPEPEEWFLTLYGIPDLTGAMVFYVDLEEPATRYFDNFNVYKAPMVAYGQAQAYIFGFFTAFGQAQAFIYALPQGYGQAQALIVNTIRSGQSHAWIENTYNSSGQARANIELFIRKQGQAQAYINSYPFNHGQAQGYIYPGFRFHVGQAEAFIRAPSEFGQAQADIKAVSRQHGQAQGYVVPPTQGYGHAQAKINSTPKRTGLAQAFIAKSQGYGQAQGYIPYFAGIKSAQAQALIEYIYTPTGLARAFITKPSPSGQAQAKIFAFAQIRIGNARAYIRRTDAYIRQGQAMAYLRRSDPTGQANALIDGRYLVKYNGYHLPGYAQSEAFNSVTKVHVSDPAYIDGPFSEYFGLDNKIISMEMLVTDRTYLGVKNQAQKAATIVRSSRNWTKLYIQTYDRYYTALTKSINIDKIVGESMRVLRYNVEWEAKPWLTRDVVHTLTGTGTIDTDQVGRTYNDGGWTPAKVLLTGTDITVSGYTELGEFAGFVSVSGAVTNLLINSDEYTATINGVNANEVLYNHDYVISIGPGKTYFDINGATNCTIIYQDRWYL